MTVGPALRILVLLLLTATLPACSDDEQTTYYCGSYTSASPGTVTTEPPC